jgi:hypothetical protein
MGRRYGVPPKINFMNEKPKSFWKKSLRFPVSFFCWLLLVPCLALVICLFGALLIDGAQWERDLDTIWVVTAICVAVVFFAFFIHWIFCWRNFKRFLFGLACFITLIALFYAEEDWRGKHDWEKFKREWEAKGEHFDFASVVPPSVPDDQNFALTPIVFTSYGSMLTRDGKMIPYEKRDTNFVNRMQMEVDDNDYQDWPTNGGNWQLAKLADLKERQNYYRALATKTNLFAVPPPPQTPAQDVLLALSKYDSTIEELREASKLPYSRFPLEWDKDDPAAILFPHLAALKRCSLVLRLHALAELQNGQSSKALDDVKLMLYLIQSIRTEPILISHLVRVAILQITLQPIYEGLVEHKWSDAQLVALDSELSKLDFLADYKLSMRGEMGFQGGIIEFLHHHPKEYDNFMGMSGDDGVSYSTPSLGSFISRLIPSGWFYQNRLNCARMMVKFYIPLADTNQVTISPKLTRRADAAVDADAKHGNPYNILERLFLPALGSSARKFAYAQSSVNLARVAIALERYRLVHGEFPESLDALAPQFMKEIPHDIINGQPLKYRRTDAGQFILYSVGWNETDDGGMVVLKKGSTPDVDINQGDWVWKYPTK